MDTLRKVASLNFALWIVVTFFVAMFAMALLLIASIAQGFSAMAKDFRDDVRPEWDGWKEIWTKEYYRSVKKEKAWEGKRFLNDGRRP